MRASEAHEAVARRVRTREVRFLASVRALVYRHPSSPYLRLLNWAGVTLGDLESQLHSDGLDRTLERLRDAGVRVTLREFRGLDPIRRSGLSIETRASDFVNPLAAGGVSGRSSGTRSAGASVVYTWNFLAEEAATELLLFAHHGLTHAALAMWMPALPGIAGLHNLLLHFKTGPPVERWFSQAPLPGWRGRPIDRAAHAYVARCGRWFGRGRAAPVHTPLDDAAPVTAWMARRAADGNRVVLKTFASSAIRVATAAAALGIELAGQTVLTGGEPLSIRRRRFLESSGLRVHPRYATTESGMVGAACGRMIDDAPDSMHVYTDRLALIGGQERALHDGHPLHSLAFTSLSMHAPRVLLNTELGDWGLARRQTCDCAFGRTGMNLFVSRLTSPEKLTGEGMTLLSSEMDDVVGALIEQRGGSPDDYQFWESQDGRGLSSLTIAVSPRLEVFDRDDFVRQLTQSLAARPGGPELAARLWRDAGSIQVIRRAPTTTAGHKMLPLVQRPDA
jgi:hypothetical protein